MTPLKLYGFWRSSATFRVRVALRYKSIPFVEEVVNLETGGQRSPEYLALNPQGALPLLCFPGERPLSQSLAILEHLEERFPSPPLLPSGMADRAWVRSLAGLLAADTHPLITPRVRAALRNQPGVDDARWPAWQSHWLDMGLRAFEARLEREGMGGPYCLGGQITLADVTLASIFAVIDALALPRPEGIPCIESVLTALDGVSAFREAAPFLQLGAPVRS